MNLSDANHGNHGFAVQLAFKKRPWTIRRLSLHHGLDRETILNRQIRMRSEIERLLSDAASKGKVAILSGESIVALKKSELFDLKAVVGKYFNDIRIVAYVRTPISYMQSIFQERLKRVARSFDVAADYPRYRSHFEKFDEVFGRDNVYICKFDLSRLYSGCVVRDFCCRFLGLDFPGDGVVKKNESLSAEAVALLYAYRKFNPPEVGMLAVKRDVALVKRLSGIKGRKFVFSERLVAPVLSSHTDDLRWIEDRIGDSSRDDAAGENAQNIGSEEELLQLAVSSVGLVEGVFPGQMVLSGVKTPEDVALVVKKIRRLLVDGEGADITETQGKRSRFDPAEKVSNRVKRKAKSTDGLSSRLVLEAFRVIRDKIEAAGIGEEIQVNSLGVFRKVSVNGRGCQIAFKPRNLARNAVDIAG